MGTLQMLVHIYLGFSAFNKHLTYNIKFVIIATRGSIRNPTITEWNFRKHEEIPRVSSEISNRNPMSEQHEWDFDWKFHCSRVGFLSVCGNSTS